MNEEREVATDLRVKTEDQFIGMKEVTHCTQLSKSSILRLERVGKFPRSYQLGQRRKVYSVNELNQWFRDVRNERIQF